MNKKVIHKLDRLNELMSGIKFEDSSRRNKW